jgi:stalled ribosome rescue protein Dom34
VAPKRKRARGFAVAILISLNESFAHLWQVYSKTVKLITDIRLTQAENDQRTLYTFHETIINTIRPILRDGVKSLIIVSPARTNYYRSFANHITKHHAWLSQGESKVFVADIQGSANTQSQVLELVYSKTFSQIISNITTKETSSLLELLEKRLAPLGKENLVLFSLGDAEALILQGSKQVAVKAEHLIMTDSYVSHNRQKNRLNRLLQVASNYGIKVRVVNSQSPAGTRITQLGGFVCVLKQD